MCTARVTALLLGVTWQVTLRIPPRGRDRTTAGCTLEEGQKDGGGIAPPAMVGRLDVA